MAEDSSLVYHCHVPSTRVRVSPSPCGLFYEHPRSAARQLSKTCLIGAVRIPGQRRGRGARLLVAMLRQRDSEEIMGGNARRTIRLGNS